MLMPIAGVVTAGVGFYGMLFSALDVKTRALPRILIFASAACIALCGVYAVNTVVVCL